MTPSPLRLRALLLMLLLGLAVLAEEAWNYAASRRHEIVSIQEGMANLARSVAQETESNIAMADVALVGFAQAMQSDKAALDQAQGHLWSQLETQPLLRSLALQDAGGRLLTGLAARHGQVLPEKPVFLAPPAEIEQHLQRPGWKLQVGAPQRAPGDDGWIIPLSRRFEDADGRLAGLVVAALDLGALEERLGGFALGRQGSIALIRDDGLLLGRFPSMASALGRHFDFAALDEAGLGGPSGRTDYVSPIDGRRRVGAYHISPRYGVGVGAARELREALAAWTLRAWVRLAVVAVLLLGSLTLGLHLTRQVLRRRAAEAARLASEAHFRLLAEHASDMVARLGPDGRFRYVSPAAQRLLGAAPAALLGRAIAEVALEEDRPALALALAEAGHPGCQGQVAFRVAREDGGTAWIETTLQRVQESGEGDGYVTVSRDVTARRALEEELSALATTDGLTGLANRRHLDEALARAWQQAVERGAPLAVLLLDIDHFKLFNDQYGHPAGDAALRATAGAIRRCIRDKDDLAARYGGEEFAVILPGAEAAGAARVAERVRQAIAGLAIPHARHPLGHVTASIGIAALLPAAQLAAAADAPDDGAPAAPPGPEQLLAAADAALYEAKRQGRNRTIAA
ncbi:diguanylate cyclase domain-containing protein [Roseomonas sp. 18066]|uniref:diguanylate cyclase domain-containing protein n=1 Tax=Roseomonas sp. 18066 TaxID=2681412 RepID=UPI00135A0742|nr:diguanylate cyclase [Roseomonas sp. 18066]